MTDTRLGRDELLITCEHGGNRIPAAYRELFAPYRTLLDSHRGYDIGALTLARDYARALSVPLVYATVSRLLVDLNRSPYHPRVYSPVTRRLPRAEVQAIASRHYVPYRREVERRVVDAAAAGRRLLHLSVHSFTPVLAGDRRRADVGLLFDPRRKPELALSTAWQSELHHAGAGLVARRNYPYRGSADGLTTYLRRRYPAHVYVGIELEVNQRYPLGDAATWRLLRRLLVDTFARSWAELRQQERGRARPAQRAKSAAPAYAFNGL